MILPPEADRAFSGFLCWQLGLLTSTRPFRLEVWSDLGPHPSHPNILTDAGNPAPCWVLRCCYFVSLWG